MSTPPPRSRSQEVRFGDRLQLGLPADLSATGEQAIDSNATVWRGAGVTVLVDEGPFADPLTSYGERPNHRMTDETIGRRRARVVSFERDDGSHYAAAHFPGAHEGEPAGSPLTVAVDASERVAREIVSSIIRSIEFL